MIILESFSLQRFNTFGINVTAQYFCRIKTKQDIIHIIQNELQVYTKHLFIGGGSNILLCNNFEGLVIKNEIVCNKFIKAAVISVLPESELSALTINPLLKKCVFIIISQ